MKIEPKLLLLSPKNPLWISRLILLIISGEKMNCIQLIFCCGRVCVGARIGVGAAAFLRWSWVSFQCLSLFLKRHSEVRNWKEYVLFERYIMCLVMGVWEYVLADLSLGYLVPCNWVQDPWLGPGGHQHGGYGGEAPSMSRAKRPRNLHADPVSEFLSRIKNGKLCEQKVSLSDWVTKCVRCFQKHSETLGMKITTRPSTGQQNFENICLSGSST